jgi:GNAT superfamily N-acetyltransferase
MEIMRKIRSLIGDMRATGVYHEARLCPRAFVRSFYKDLMILEFDDDNGGRIIATAGLWSTIDPYTLELGTLYVDKDHAGNGVGRKVFSEAMQRVWGDTSCVFTIMRAPRAMAIALEAGFRLASAEDPEIRSWAASAGIIERLPKDGDGRNLLVRRF